MKLKCRIGLHEIYWDDHVLRDSCGYAVQRGQCRHCGLIRQRLLSAVDNYSRVTSDDPNTRNTGPAVRIKL